DLNDDDGYALQLMLYAIMVFDHRPEVERLRAGIIPLRKPSQAEGTWLNVAGSDIILRDQLDDMRSLVMQLIAELLDPAVPFAHSPKSKYCTSCVAQ
ncbi:MAG TPA: PD-(D/E)XK nuclease family protein, partial [Flavobacteriales bacterium]|nr:PD-(D/E)XK nuclease family protein [Flavobacteriales bacterium]